MLWGFCLKLGVVHQHLSGQPLQQELAEIVLLIVAAAFKTSDLGLPRLSFNVFEFSFAVNKHRLILVSMAARIVMH